jgi:hypothetical protein
MIAELSISIVGKKLRARVRPTRPLAITEERNSDESRQLDNVPIEGSGCKGRRATK